MYCTCSCVHYSQLGECCELHTVLTKGITFEEVQQFAHVLDCLNDLETALSMYSAAGASVTQGEGDMCVRAGSRIFSY